MLFQFRQDQQRNGCHGNSTTGVVLLFFVETAINRRKQSMEIDEEKKLVKLVVKIVIDYDSSIVIDCSVYCNHNN